MKSYFGAALIAAVASAYGVQDDYIHGYMDKHHEPEIFAVFRQTTEDDIDGYQALHDPYHPHGTHWEPLESHSPHMFDYVEHHYQDFDHEGHNYGYTPYVDEHYIVDHGHDYGHGFNHGYHEIDHGQERKHFMF